MTLTAEQLDLRRQGIGASEAAAVLGLSPWRTPVDVYWSKVLDPEPAPPTEAMSRGIALEPYILDRLAEDMGLPLRRDVGTIVDPVSTVLMATPDDIVPGQAMAVEAKTASLMDGWGEQGTDEIPMHYLVQTHHQMAVLNRAGYEVRRVLVPVLFFTMRPEYRLYAVDRNEAVEQAIVGDLLGWWQRHVIARVPPAEQPPALDVLKRLRREPASVVDLSDRAITEIESWQAAKELAKEHAEEAEEMQARVLALLGTDAPAEAGRLPDGRLLTYLTQKSAPRVDHDRLRTQFPDAYAACVAQGCHRVLRVKKGGK
jgi:putative phage-type endonuclease